MILMTSLYRADVSWYFDIAKSCHFHVDLWMDIECLQTKIILLLFQW